jgi:ClpP class serine protease
MGDIAFPRLRAGREPFPSYMRAGAVAPLSSGIDPWGEYTVDQLYLRQFQKRGGGDIAVVPIKGSMSRDGFCNMGNEQIANILSLAATEETVSAVVLHMNTPGGTVDSTRMLAETVRDFPKPVIVQTAYCCSAGVFVASQADEIWLEEQSATEVGSIGVLMVYVNEAKALEAQGYDVQIMRADGSEQKALLNGIEPLSDSTLAEVRDSLNASRREFIGFVRRGRAGKVTSDEAFTGATFGIKKALELGLADRVGSLDAAVKRARQLAKSH